MSNTKCYLIVEINWDEAGQEFPCEVWLNKELAEQEVSKRNESVEFEESGIAKFNKEFNCRLSWGLREVDFNKSSANYFHCNFCDKCALHQWDEESQKWWCFSCGEPYYYKGDIVV